MAHQESKSKSSSRRTPTTLSPTQSLPPEDYQRRVAEAAYFRALQRGFQGGDPVDDWVAAEREIGRQLRSDDQPQE